MKQRHLHLQLPQSLRPKETSESRRKKESKASAELAASQVYFEVEVNGQDVVYLENLAGSVQRWC